MNAEFYIWKDAIDSNWFILGVKLSNGTYAAESSLFTDAIYDLFGREFHEAIKNVKPGMPVQVELTYTIKL